MALVALLGLNSLSFLFWLLSFAAKSPSNSAWLGESWLWLTGKLARGPDAALVPRALLEVLGRNNTLRWLLGGIRSEEHTSELQSLMRSSYAVFCLKNKIHMNTLAPPTYTRQTKIHTNHIPP